jgi:antimicrobial peptide system SdpB family protein
MLTTLGRYAQHSVERGSPFRSVYGLARTLIALSTLSTLLFSRTDTLFLPISGQTTPNCSGAASLGLYCLLPHGQLELGRWLSVLILLLVASGYRPRFTAPLHVFCTFSLLHNASMLDGGDQLAANLALLLLPCALLDPRRWHWSPAATGSSPEALLIARAALFLIRLQMCAVYLQASVAKLAVREWVDGTVLYYWLRDPAFGSPPWLAPFTDALVKNGTTVSLLTWSVLGLELALAAALVMPRDRARWLLPLGIALHLGIALVHGLVSFALVMFGGLVLYLWPVERPWPSTRWLEARGAGGPAGLENLLGPLDAQAIVTACKQVM